MSTNKPERAAPGHKYLERLGSGILWRPKTAKLYERGVITLEAEHDTGSPYQFWHSLAFVDAFPQITHWWFHSAWTQRVRLTKAQGMADAGSIYGWMQFIDEQQPSQTWTILERGGGAIIETPYPPNEVKPVNLPLRLALARIVAGTLTDDVIPDRWMGVTSLVRSDQLAEALPTRMDALNWQLAGVETNIREAFCRLQGIKPKE